MELAVAAARSPSGSLLSGKYGIGMLSIGGTAPAQMERHTANWGLYEETARANGHVPDRKNWRVVGMFHIAETREQARKNVQFGVQAFANYFRDVATFPIIPPDVPELTYDVVARRVEWGSRALLELIITRGPRWSLFGHVHQPLAARMRVGRTECVNVGHFQRTVTLPTPVPA